MIGVLAFSFFIICGCWYCALIEKCCEPQRIWVDSKHPAVSFISIDSLFEKELYIQKVYCINRCTFYCPQQFISPSHPNNISNKMIHKCTKCEYQTPYKSNYGIGTWKISMKNISCLLILTTSLTKWSTSVINVNIIAPEGMI